MENKPYVVIEFYHPKAEHVEDLMNILNETSEMIKEQDGALMSLSLNPEQKNGAITSFTMWESRGNFTDFMKSAHMEKIMKSGLVDKVKGWTTDIKANLYTVDQAWHVETHE